jgi:hypothetical protein
MKLRIKITFETEHLLVLRKLIKTREWCEECQTKTDFISTENIQGLFLKLNRNFQTDNLHTFQTSDGSLLVCLESLLKDQA